MNKKNKVIVGLLAIAIVLFCAIQFWVIPTNRAKEAEYARNQTDALTHDISVVEDYKTAYIGNANNVSGLFEVLPLNNVSMKFEINSEDCILTVNYLDTVWNIGEEKVQRDLVYNSVAAMAAIDNLAGITYNFSGNSYSFNRKQIEEVFGSPISNLLNKDVWTEKVQEPLNSTDFVKQFFNHNFNTHPVYETQKYLEAFISQNYAVKSVVYTGTPIDMATAEIQEAVVLGNNASNSVVSPNGKAFRILVQGDLHKVVMIDDENKQYSTSSTENVMQIQYKDFHYLESGTETINQIECVFDVYDGKQIVNGTETPMTITVYLQADDKNIYALKTERDTSSETILIQEMRTDVNAAELECPTDYQEVDNNTFNREMF